jgi:acetylornithine deacetylase
MERLTSVEKQALNAVDRDGIVTMLTELLAVPSVSGSDAECDIQHVLAKSLGQLDLDVDLWSMDLEELHREPDFPGAEAARTEAWGLVGTHHGETPQPALILQGHVDVVPPGDRAKWTRDPFRPLVTAQRVHGRGACDMKAGVVANLAALQAIRTSGASLRGGFAIHCAVGEEDGGLGAFGTLRRGHTGETCIITEPTNGTLVTGNAGALTFRIEVPGAATHGSTRYAGSSAIDSYLEIHRALHRLEVERNRVVEPLMREYPIAYPISVGRIRAGDWSSSVPDLLVAEGRLGLRIDEDPAEAREQLREVVHQVSARDPFLRDHPPVLTWSGGQFRGGQLPPDHSLRHIVGQAHADSATQMRPRERGAPYGSDLRLYQASGIPTLHYGPGDVRLAHGPNESVGIDEIVQVTQTLVLTILRICG